jgi:DNA-binding NarL/FixJ family response regulator
MNKIIKLAIVDDSPFFRTGLVSHLQANNKLQIVIECSNGQELIDGLKLGKHKPDIILLDLEMPVMNGIKATEYLSKYYPDIKILILTVHTDDKISYRLMGKGVNGFIPKHNYHDNVMLAIDTVYTSKYYFADYDFKKILAATKQQKEPNGLQEVCFTPRELEVLKLICLQHTTKEIADKLCLSKRTIDRHRENIFKKTGVRKTAGLFAYAIKYGITD